MHARVWFFRPRARRVQGYLPVLLTSWVRYAAVLAFTVLHTPLSLHLPRNITEKHKNPCPQKHVRLSWQMSTVGHGAWGGGSRVDCLLAVVMVSRAAITLAASPPLPFAAPQQLS
jgi:hypothetical protein